MSKPFNSTKIQPFLEPCPFCAERVYLCNSFVNHGDSLFYVKCPVCSYCGPEGSHNHVVSHWNSRVLNDSLKMEINYLKKELREWKLIAEEAAQNEGMWMV